MRVPAQRLLALTGLLLGLGATGSPTALAVALPGPLAVLPAHGTDQNALTVVTASPCPAGTNLIVKISGPGFPARGQNIVGNAPLTAFEHTKTGGVVVPVSLILRDIANLPTKQVQYAGTYSITVICRDRVRLPTLGSFVGTLAFSDPHTYTARNSATITTDVAPLDPAAPPVTTGGAPGPAATSSGTPNVQAPQGSSVASGSSAGSAGVAGYAAARRGSWLDWVGPVVLGLGTAGLLLSAVTALRRRSATLPS